MNGIKQAPWHRTEYDDNYGSCDRTIVSFRIYPGATDPDEVTRILSIAPTEIQRAGEAVTNRFGRTRVVKLNGWFLESEHEITSLDLRRHLDWLLDLLLPKKAQLKEVQALQGVTMNVNCVWWSKALHGGPTLWPEQMRGLADLELECSFEFADYSNQSAIR